MKKILSLLTALAMSASMAVCVSAADKENAEPDVIVNGSGIIFDDQNAKIVDDVTLVPARGVFEAMGNTVSWDGETREVKVTASTGVREVLITIDSDVMKVTTYKTIFERTTEEVTLEVPAQIVNDRTMIPLRAVSEAFDCTVEWDADNYAVNITTGEPPLLEGGIPDAKTPVDEMVSMSLSTDTTEIKAGDEFTVYVDVTNIPEGNYLSSIVAAFEYDKNVFEYVEGSGTLLNDNDEAYEASVSAENTDEYDLGTKVIFVTIDETIARTKDGHVYKATFKSVNGEAGEIKLNNRFRSITGYESYVMLTTKANGDGEIEDVIYDGDNLNLITTPITIGE